MPRRQQSDRLRCGNIGWIGTGGDAQFADLEPLGERDLPHQLMKFGRGPFAVAQHDLAKQCGRDALPVEQRNAEVRLELLQRARQGRLGHAKILGGEAEMAAPGERLYDLDLTDGVHVFDWFWRSDNNGSSADTIICIGPRNCVHNTFKGHKGD